MPSKSLSLSLTRGLSPWRRASWSSSWSDTPCISRGRKDIQKHIIWFNYTRSIIRKYRLIIDIQTTHMYTSIITKCINIWCSHSPFLFLPDFFNKTLLHWWFTRPLSSRPPGSGRATYPSARCYAIVVLPPLPHRAAARTSGGGWKSIGTEFQMGKCPKKTLEIVENRFLKLALNN